MAANAFWWRWLIRTLKRRNSRNLPPGLVFWLRLPYVAVVIKSKPPGSRRSGRNFIFHRQKGKFSPKSPYFDCKWDLFKWLKKWGKVSNRQSAYTRIAETTEWVVNAEYNHNLADYSLASWCGNRLHNGWPSPHPIGCRCFGISCALYSRSTRVRIRFSSIPIAIFGHPHH